MEFETKVLSRQIQEALYNHNETLGTAESCTGGRIAEAIISVPGASQYFKGGVVSYTNEVKENLLHVSAQVLAEQTAVCEEVAREMVIGACDVLNCDYAISVTGVAGPGGGTAHRHRDGRGSDHRARRRARCGAGHARGAPAQLPRVP